MNTTEIMYIIIALGIMGFVIYKQLTWRILTPRKVFKLPLILGIMGVVMLGMVPVALTAADVAMTLLETVLGAGIGLLMGRIATIRRSQSDKADFESRLGGAGLLLWVLMIAMRLGLGFWAHHMGLAMAASPGIIYLVVAANRAANGWMLLARTRTPMPALQTR